MQNVPPNTGETVLYQEAIFPVASVVFHGDRLASVEIVFGDQLKDLPGKRLHIPRNPNAKYTWRYGK